METLRFVIAKNLVKLRKNKKITQAELAEQLHYSDKAVSKWETGETAPTIDTLKELSDFYGIKVDDLLKEDFIIEEIKEKSTHSNSRTIISLLGISCVWLIGTLSFIFSIIYNGVESYPWMAFIACVPISMILAIVFNTLWGPIKRNYIYISILVWSALVFTYLAILCYSNLVYNLWPIFFVGVPGQIIVILWSRIKKQ